MIENSSVNVTNLRFLVGAHSLTTRIYNRSWPSGINAIDLYADIRDSLAEIEVIPTTDYANLKDALSVISGPLFHLKQFERSSIWGLGL